MLLECVALRLGWNPTLETLGLYIDFTVDFKAVGFLTARACSSVTFCLGVTTTNSASASRSLRIRPTGAFAPGSLAPVVSVANAAACTFQRVCAQSATVAALVRPSRDRESRPSRDRDHIGMSKR